MCEGLLEVFGETLASNNGSSPDSAGLPRAKRIGGLTRLAYAVELCFESDLCFSAGMGQQRQAHAHEEGVRIMSATSRR